MRPVVVLGDVMVDVVARVDGPIAVGSDTPAEVRVRPGGAGANVAVWLAAAGVPATLVARAGDDPTGRDALARLGRRGVHARIALDPRRPTGTCVVLVGPDGERSMLPDPGANAALSAVDLPADAFADAAHLHVAGYALLRGGPPREAAVEALRRARSAGMTISIDPSSAAPLRAVGAARLRKLTGRVDLLLPNAAEAAVLAGGDPQAAAGALVASGLAAEAVVTLGAGGAVWSDGRRVERADAIRSAAVRDTTGAGDAFAAGFLAAWLHAAPAAAALQGGTALAARAIGAV